MKCLDCKDWLLYHLSMKEKITSAGFIVRSKDGKYLVGRAQGNTDTHCWSVFKGHQEDGEELIDTAIRELREESGIDISLDERLYRNISTSPVFKYSFISKKKHKDVELFLLEDIHGVLDTFEFKCSSFWGGTNPEIFDYKWVTVNELDTMLFLSQRGLVQFLKNKYGE